VDRSLSPAELAAVEDLVHRTRQAGIALTGPDGLLKAMTETVIEAALEEEIADHLGYDKYAVEGRNQANSRNRTRSKTVPTESCGEVDIDVPRDRGSTVQPQPQPQLPLSRLRRLSTVTTSKRSPWSVSSSSGRSKVRPS